MPFRPSQELISQVKHVVIRLREKGVKPSIGIVAGLVCAETKQILSTSDVEKAAYWGGFYQPATRHKSAQWIFP